MEEAEPKQNSMAAFSPKRDELHEALSILYIRNNASGRNKFKENWPEVAPYLFGEQLMKYDHDGWSDPEHCRELEDLADQKRVLLKETIDEMVTKSVDAGMLQFEYVGKVIDNFGPLLSTYLYAEDVIERVRPGILAPARTAAENGESIEPVSAAATPNATPKPSSDPIESEAPLSQREAEILSNKPADDLDDVQPIETPEPSQDMSAVPSATDLDNVEPKAGDEDKSASAEPSSVPAAEEAPLDPVIAEAMKIREEAIGTASFESNPAPSAEESSPAVEPEPTADKEETQTASESDGQPKAEQVVSAPSPAPAQEERVPPMKPALDDLDDVMPIDMGAPPPIAPTPQEVKAEDNPPSAEEPKIEESKPVQAAPMPAAAPAEGEKPKPSIFGSAPKPKEQAEPEKAAGFKKGLMLALFNTAAKAA